MKTQQERTAALVLVSPGFAEEATVRCVTAIRKSGIETKLLGLTSGHTVGAHGLTIRSDVTLTDLEPWKKFRLIVVTGSSYSERSYLADPRTMQLFEKTAKEGGWIAVLNRAETSFVQAGLIDLEENTNVIFQRGQDTCEFVERLVNLVTE